MRLILLSVAGALCFSSACHAHAGGEPAPQEVVQLFYDAFNAHRFDRVPHFTTKEWNHINPGGGRTIGRSAVLQELNEVHSTFLKGVTDTIESMDSRVAAPSVVIVTVKSRMSRFTMPDGVTHANEAHIRTFVLVQQKSHWLITQDQNTTVGE